MVFATEAGYTGHKHLLSNYGKTTANPNATQDYGANGKYPWLADYANNWIPSVDHQILLWGQSKILTRVCKPTDIE